MLRAAQVSKVLIIDRTPSKNAFIGESYSGSVQVSFPGETVQYSLAGAPAGLTIDSANGNIRWNVPSTEKARTLSFQVTASSVPSNLTTQIAVSLELLARSELINTPVTNAGGVFTDKSGSYRVTIPANSVAAGGTAGFVVLLQSVNASGNVVLKKSYSGFAPGTQIVEDFPKPINAIVPTTKTQNGLTKSLAAVSSKVELKETVVHTISGVLHEASRKKSWEIDAALLAKFYRPNDYVISTSIPKESDAAEDQFYDTSEDGKEIARLTKYTTNDSSKPIALFIHGFSATDPMKLGFGEACPYGGYLSGQDGKEATWGTPGSLINKMGEAYQVFEFQWRTCQPFELVAAELAQSINQIYSDKYSDKKITIFAHSMGGVVTSALLQKKFFATYAPDFDPQQKIHKVYYFDSPVGGIARRADQATNTFPAGGELVNGRDITDWSIDKCFQITCFQLGISSEDTGYRTTKRIMQLYFEGVASTVEGQFAKDLIAGWDSFTATSPKFSVNALMTDYPGRINYSDGTIRDKSATLPPGDMLIDNRAIALHPSHFELDATKATVPDITDLGLSSGVQYLQRYYRKADSASIKYTPTWAEFSKITAGSSNLVVKFGAKYPSKKTIPSYLNYYATTQYHSHSEVALASSDKYNNLPGVVRYKPDSDHIFDYFIALSATEASQVEAVNAVALVTSTLSITGTVVNQTGTVLPNQPYSVNVSCNAGTGTVAVFDGSGLTAANGSFNTVSFNTSCNANSLTARITVGNSAIYRQYQEAFALTPVSSNRYNVRLNSGQNVRLLTLLEISSKTDTDFVFLTDLSGSYGDDLTTFKSLSSAILNEIRDNGARVRVAVASFIEFPAHSGYSLDYAYRLDSPFNYDLSPASTAISRMTIGSGGDGPESQLEALYRLSQLSWTSSSQKIIVMATDATYHNKDTFASYPGKGYTETLAALNALGIKVYVLQPTTSTIAGYATLTAATGGAVLNAGSGSANIVCNIRNILNKTNSVCSASAIAAKPALIKNIFSETGRLNP